MATRTTPQTTSSGGSDTAGAAAVRAARGPSVLRELFTDRLSRTGLLIVVAFGLAAILAPWLAPHDPNAQDVVNRLLGPGAAHPLGTDSLGRDILSRLLFGARWSLGIAAIATVIVIGIGLMVGTVSGYYGGWLDTVIMRVVDVLLAFPSLVLFLAIIGTLGTGVHIVLLALVSASWVSYAHVVRGIVLSLREHDFVQSSVAFGATDGWVMRRHILPGVISPIVVLASLQTGRLVLSLAALGFFGLGVQPPTPEWGTMLNQGRVHIQTAPHVMLFPGLAISLVVLGFNLLGDGLRDVLDPRLRL